MLADSLSVWLLLTICEWSFQSWYWALIPRNSPPLDIKHLSGKVFAYYEIMWSHVCISFLLLLRAAPVVYSLGVTFTNTSCLAICSPRYFQITWAWQGNIKVFYLCIFCVSNMIKKKDELEENAQLSSIGKRRTFQRLNGEGKSPITQNPERV